MSYTPSTKATGFKNRSVPDMSKDIAALAKAKDKQRASDVANFQQQANGQLTELARQDSVMTQNDAYELANLKQFSNTLNDFLDTSAKTLGKAYIDVKRREGTELARKYRAGDQDAIAKIDGTQAQLDEVEKKLAEQKEKAIATSQKFLEDEARLNLKQKLQALNIRKLGSNVSYGFMKSTFNEAALGYKPYLEAQLNSSEESLTFPKELGGETIMIKDYRKLTNVDQKQYVEGVVEDRYLEENNPFGASESVVYRYLTKSVTQQTDEYREQKFQQEKKNQGADEIIDRRTTLLSAAKNFDFDETLDYGTVVEGNEVKLEGGVKTTKDIIQEMLNLGSYSHSLNNPNGANNVANREQIIKDLTTFMKTADADSRQEIYQFLTDERVGKFFMRGQGEKLLEDHFVGDLDLLKIMAEADSEDAQKDLAEQKALKLRFNNGVKSLKQLYFNGNEDGSDFTLNDYKNGLQEFMNNNNNFLDLDNVNVELKKAQDWEPDILNKRASLVYLAGIVDGPGKVTREEWNRMHPDVKILVQDQKLLIEEPFGFDEQNFTDVVKAQNERMETHLKDIGGANKTTADFVTNSIADAVKFSETDLLAKAEFAFKSGQYDTKADAYKAVVQQTIDEYAEKKDNPNYDYYFDLEKGFINTKPKSTTKADLLLSEGAIAKDNLEAKIKYSNSDAIATTKLLSEINLQPRRNKLGVVVGFNSQVSQLQKLDTQGRTKFEIHNLQAKANGREDLVIDISELTPAQQVIQTNLEEKYKHLRGAFNSDSTLEKESALDEMGAISTAFLGNALVDVDIYEGDLSTILENQNITMEQYTSDPDIRTKVNSQHLNDLIQTAVAQTDNKNQALLMVAHSYRNGKDMMGSYKLMMQAGSLTDNVQDDKDFAFGIVDSYYSGDTTKLDGGFPRVSIAANTNNQSTLTKVIQNSGAGTTEDLTQQLNSLNSLEPEKYVSINVSGRVVQGLNPLYTKWQKKKTIIESRIAGQEILSDKHKSWDGTNWKPSQLEFEDVKLMIRAQHFSEGKVAGAINDPYSKLVEKFKKTSGFSQEGMTFMSYILPGDNRNNRIEAKNQQNFYNFLRKELQQ
tara:strand:+ start:1127 stop:4378 length:3252 start_codon:yes stop_codon:yes gene_type:complete